MCAGSGGMSAGMSSGIGFGLDALGALGQYGEQRRQTREANRSIAIQNRLKINAYETKNRNEENIWRNSKIDGDIEVDNKWRETQDALAEAQLKARQVAGEAALSQQKILAKMINAGGREQAGRRSGRGGIAELGQQFAAAGAQAAFSRDSEILFRDKAGRNMAAFAQGKYVEYITGRPSPEAPPLLQEFKQGPSFLNTALSIASSGFKRYQQYQDTKAPQVTESGNPYEFNPGPNNSNIPSFGDTYNSGASIGTMEVPQYEIPQFQQNPFLQQELDDYVSSKTFNTGQSLGFETQNTFL